ncbi:MAG TPA: ATP-binding protein [Thermoleophilaceae bacterium]|nr:ATP-binding protein [Thermoleophilaceae bacterium]
MEGFGKREHSIKADLARLKEARDFAERAAEDFGFDSSGCYQLKLAMSEAVTNAIQHGSSSEDDPIDLRVEAEGEALTFYVKDTGTFVEKPLAGADSFPESGRGLEFMRRLMDDVELRPGEDGTLLRFAKRPAPEA